MDTLRPIHFYHGEGRYFAVRLDGQGLLFADSPELEGKNLLDLHNDRNPYIIRDMIKICRQSGEGFYEYKWTKPGKEGKKRTRKQQAEQSVPFKNQQKTPQRQQPGFLTPKLSRNKTTSFNNRKTVATCVTAGENWMAGNPPPKFPSAKGSPNGSG